MNWTATSALTALGVTTVVALVAWFPGWYMAWGLAALFVAVFGWMLLRNPAYRYMRLAWWLAAAWVAAVVVPEVRARVQLGGEAYAELAIGSHSSFGVHLAFAVGLVVCLLLDYFLGRENGALLPLFDRVRVRFGGQRQHVTGGTGIQIGDVGDQASVTVHQTDPNRELDHARELLNKGKPDAAEEHLLRIKRDHGMALTVQQRYRLQAYFGQVFHDRGDPAKAAVHFRNARDLRHDAEGEAHGALADFLAGDFDSAYRLAVDLLQRHPESALAAAVMIRSAPPDVPAATLAARVSEAIADDIDVLSALAFRYLADQDPATSEVFARRARAKRPDHPNVLGAVAVAIVQGEAIAATDRLGEGGPDPAARCRLEEAVTLLTAAMGASSPGERRRFQSARALGRDLLGRQAEAEADHIAAVEGDPTCAETVVRYAAFLYRRERHADGLSVLRPLLLLECTPEPAFLFGVMALEGGGPGDKEQAVSFLRLANSPASAKHAKRREELIGILAFLTLDTAGLDPALAVLKGLAADENSGAMVAAGEAELYLRAGNQAAAGEAASAALEKLTERSDLDHKLRVAQVVGRLERYRDVVVVLGPLATADNYELVGRRALVAASRCGDHDFVIRYTELLRRAGRWDREIIETEVETCRRYGDYDRAVAVCREFIARAPDERDRRFARLRLSLVGLQSGRRDLVEADPEKLPQVGEVEPRTGRLLCGVLEAGAGREAAVAAAYELVRRHYASPEAHIALCMAVGVVRRDSVWPPDPEFAAPGAAVRFRMDREAVSRWVVIEDGPEPDPARNEFPPDHPRAKGLLGKRAGDRFTDRSNRFQERTGVVEEVRSKYRYRAWESISQWGELFPRVPFVLKFDLERPDGDGPDFGPIVKVIEEQEQTEERLLAWYREHPVSTLMLAQAARRHPIEVIGHVANRRDLPIRCCEGTVEDFAEGTRASGEARLVADPSALATVFVTSLWRGITTLPFGLVVCRSELDGYLRLAEELRHATDEYLARRGDELIRVGIPAEEREDQLRAYEGFVAWLRSVADVRSGIALARLPQQERVQLVALYGQPAAESIAWAIEESLPIWTDDYTVPVVIRSGRPVQRTWTQLVAGRLNAERVISDDALAGLLTELVSIGYEHTQYSPAAMLAAARVSGWDAARRPFSDGLRWLANERVNDAGVFGVAIIALRLVWRNAPLYEQRASATLGIGRTLASRTGGRDLVRGVAEQTDRLFPLEPDTAAQYRNVLLRSLDGDRGAGPRLIVPV